MKDVGGKGRVGLMFIAYRIPFERRPDDGFTVDGGFMLDVHPGGNWLLSFGLKGLGTVGIGWVSKVQRQLDAYHAASEHLPEPAYDTIVVGDDHQH